jgi:hypothetical protein
MFSSAEPIAVGKRPGDEVVGGTVNQSGGFRCRTTRVEADTVLARNPRLVEDAQAGKPPLLRYGAGQGIGRAPSAPRNANGPFLMYAAAQRMFARVRTMTAAAEGASKN